MRTLGNILWHIPFLGFISAFITFVIGILLTVTIIAAPVGVGLIEYSKFLLAPFGKVMVSKNDLNIERNSVWKAYSTVIMIIYFPFGLIFAIISIFQIVGMAITIVGIPVAIVMAKSLGTTLNPVNKKCVSVAIVDEMQRRKAAEAIDSGKY